MCNCSIIYKTCYRPKDNKVNIAFIEHLRLTTYATYADCMCIRIYGLSSSVCLLFGLTSEIVFNASEVSRNPMHFNVQTEMIGPMDQ